MAVSTCAAGSTSASGIGLATSPPWPSSQRAARIRASSSALQRLNSQVLDGWFRTGVADQAENARTILDYGPVEAQYQLSLGRILYDGFEP
jgi:hypothetical protein